MGETGKRSCACSSAASFHPESARQSHCGRQATFISWCVPEAASKKFYLLSSLVESLNAHLTTCFVLSDCKACSETTKYIKSYCFLFTLCWAVWWAGTGETIESIQPQMFKMVVECLYLQDCQDVQKVSGTTKRKICAVGKTKLITETPAMLEDPRASLWTPLLQALISLPEDDSVPTMKNRQSPMPRFTWHDACTNCQLNIPQDVQCLIKKVWHPFHYIKNSLRLYIIIDVCNYESWYIYRIMCSISSNKRQHYMFVYNNK